MTYNRRTACLLYIHLCRTLYHML